MRVTKVLPLIGILIFAWVLLHIDIHGVGQTLLRLNIALFLGAIALTGCNILIKSYKWRLLFNSSYGLHTPFPRFLNSWLVGLSLSLITPGKIGDFTKAAYLKEETGLGKSLTTVLADRIIDMITLFLFAIVGMMAFAFWYSPKILLLSGTFIAFIGFLVLTYVCARRSYAHRLGKFLLRWTPVKYHQRLRALFNDVYEGVAIMRQKKKVVVAVILLTSLVWVLTSLVMYLIALALSLDIPFPFMLIVFPIITLLEALPISFSGLGTRDAALISFFSYVGISAEATVSLSLLYLLVSYIFAGIGFAIWSKNPLKL